MNKRGHILSYDFEHLNALPEWACDFTSHINTSSGRNLNRRRLIKVHMDTAVQATVPYTKGYFMILRRSAGAGALMSQHSAASPSYIFTTFITSPKYM